jgi:hypothetical protein
MNNFTPDYAPGYFPGIESDQAALDEAIADYRDDLAFYNWVLPMRNADRDAHCAELVQELNDATTVEETINLSVYD